MAYRYFPSILELNLFKSCLSFIIIWLFLSLRPLSINFWATFKQLWYTFLRTFIKNLLMFISLIKISSAKHLDSAEIMFRMTLWSLLIFFWFYKRICLHRKFTFSIFYSFYAYYSVNYCVSFSLKTSYYSFRETCAWIFFIESSKVG